MPDKYKSTIQHHAFVIQELVRLVDELRQPYNNSQHHDLYVKACNLLNKLDEWNMIPRLPQQEPEGWVAIEEDPIRPWLTWDEYMQCDEKENEGVD